jgi:IPT/TIG domain-containing protein
MLGSFIHGATSLADYMGNNRFSRRWTWFYVLRPVIGMALALVFYFVIRGGFLTTNVGPTDINPYGIAALAGLVGMFSKQATDKLSEVFTTLFRSGEGDQKRSDPLTGTKSTPVKIEPEEVEVGSEALTIVVTGAGFVADSVVHLNDSPLTTRLDSPTQLSVDVPAEMFAEPAVLKLTVVNRDGTPSTPVELKVVAPATPVSLSIQSVAPAQVAAAAAVPLTVNGAGFVVDSIVKLNEVEQVTEFVDSAKLTVNLTVASIPTAGVVALKVVNPDGTESNTFDLTAT